jgi:DNA repair protein RadB
MTEKENKISSGSSEFDEWLNGGYDTDVITVFYGPAGSGKTNLCLIAAAEQAALGKKVVFIDTEGGFSVERLRQLADLEVLKNIVIIKATTFYEQKMAFDKLLEVINKNVSLIVVDSLVMLYRLELGQASSQKNYDKVNIINRMLAKQLRILSEIARKKNVAILCTDQVYGEFLTEEEMIAGKQKSFNMVGGDIIKYWAKCIIKLENYQHGRKKATLVKHRSLPEKKFEFEIINEGIKKRKGIF